MGWQDAPEVQTPAAKQPAWMGAPEVGAAQTPVEGGRAYDPFVKTAQSFGLGGVAKEIAQNAEPIQGPPKEMNPIVTTAQAFGEGVSQLGKGLGELNPFTKDQPRDPIGGTLRTGQGLLDVGLGAFGAATSPFIGPTRAVGNIAERATGGLLRTGQVQTALGAIGSPKGMQKIAPPAALPKGPIRPPLGGTAKPAWASAPEVEPLVPARQLPSGAVDAGIPGQKHKDLLAQEGTTKARTPPEQLGFAKPSGEFLSREQAAKEVGAPVEKLHTSDLAKSVGAEAAPPPEPTGKAPARRAITSTEDDIFRVLRSRPQERDIGIQERYKALPEEAKAPGVQEKLYRFGEGDPTAQLTPQERALFDAHVAPRLEKNRQIFEEVRSNMKAQGATDEEMSTLHELDPRFMHRMVQGKTRELDETLFEASPETGASRGRSLGDAPGLHGAVYHALEDAQGTRKLVVEKGNHLFRIDPEKGLVRIAAPNTEIRPGMEIAIDGQPWRLKRARTGEIEAETGARYHKNAFVSAELNGAQLERAAEELALVKRIKDDPALAPFMTKRVKAAPPNWRGTKLPAFSGYRMDPHIARMLDDIAPREKNRYLEGLARANRAMIGTLFWNPVPHLANVGTHAFAANGWQNFNPLHYPASLRNAARAMKEVVSQGPLYREMLKEGSSLIYSRVKNQGMWEDMMRGFGETMAENPERTGLAALAHQAKVPFEALYNAVYKPANKALWAGGDVFMMHRVMELRDRGVPLRQAIFEAERDIPNYRVPAEVWQGPGGRIASEALRNQTFNLFGRYHYGVARGLATVVKDIAVGDTETRVDALGKAVSLAALAGAAYPIVGDPLVRAILGEANVEDLSKATGEPPTATRRGPAGPIQTAIDAFAGRGIDWNGVARGAGFAESPVDQFIVALLANADWKGSKIIEPASPVQSQIAQGVGFAVGQAVAPAAQVERYLKSPEALRAFFADAITGYKKTPPPGGWAATIGRRAAQKRAKKPNNVIEEYLSNLGGGK